MLARAFDFTHGTVVIFPINSSLTSFVHHLLEIMPEIKVGFASVESFTKYFSLVTRNDSTSRPIKAITSDK